MASPPSAEPLKREDAAGLADGAIVLVLARESMLSRVKGTPVFINGIGWSQDSPNIAERDFHTAAYASLAAERAYRMAGIRDPGSEIDFAEVTTPSPTKSFNTWSPYGWPPWGSPDVCLNGASSTPAAACRSTSPAETWAVARPTTSRAPQRSRSCPAIAGPCGERQLLGVKRGLAQSWRGIPTATGGVAILGSTRLAEVLNIRELGTQRIPQVNGARVIRALRRAGWEVRRISGSHQHLFHPMHPGRRISVTVHSVPMKKGALAEILQKAELSVQEFVDLL